MVRLVGIASLDCVASGKRRSSAAEVKTEHDSGRPTILLGERRAEGIDALEDEGMGEQKDDAPASSRRCCVLSSRMGMVRALMIKEGPLIILTEEVERTTAAS